MEVHPCPPSGPRARGEPWTRPVRAVFEPNNERLWARLVLVVDTMLNGLFRSGALQGQTPKDAYFVKCGLGQTMTAADIAAGRTIVEIGFAPLKPAEFIVLRILLQAQAA